MATISEESTARKEELRSNQIRANYPNNRAVKERSSSQNRSAERQANTQPNFKKKEVSQEERKNSIRNRQPPKTVSTGFGTSNAKDPRNSL